MTIAASREPQAVRLPIWDEARALKWSPDMKLIQLDFAQLSSVTGGSQKPGAVRNETTREKVGRTAAACATGAVSGAVTGAAIGALGGASVLPAAGLGALGGCVRGAIMRPRPAN